MGVIAITETLRKKSILIALSLSLSISLSCIATTTAVYANNDATLSKLEKWLFFCTFAGDSDEVRIKRIEEKTFGDAAEGPLDERLSKLDKILSERQKEKEEQEKGADSSSGGSSAVTTGTGSGGASSDPSHNFGSSPAAADASGFGGGNAGGSTGNFGTTGSGQAQSSQSLRDDPAAAKERQRIAVQAAREQEMKDLLKEGARLWRSRHGTEALEQFQQVLRLDPQNPDANFSIGIIQESQGKLKDAKAHYEMAAQRNPDNRDYQEAIAAVSRRLQATPADPNRALLAKANAAFKRGEYISALNMFKELEGKEPKQASVKYSLGTTFLMMKDHFSALAQFKMAHQLEPNNAKYTTAYNDLSAEMAKHQEAQQGVEELYHPGQQASAAEHGSNKKKQKGKTAAAPPGSYPHPQAVPVQKQAPMQQAMLPQQQPMQQPMRQAPLQQPMRQPAPLQQQQMMRPSPPMQQQPMQNQQYTQQIYQNGQSQGTYIPPDPQAYASAPSQQQQMGAGQMPAQAQPLQQQAQNGGGGQYAGGGGGQYAGGGGGQYGGGGGGQYAGGGGGGQYAGGGGQYAGGGGGQYAGGGGGQYGGGGGGGGQYGGGGGGGQYGGGGQEFTPPPQAAPQGAFDARLAEKLNHPASSGMSSKGDPMAMTGLSGRASEQGVMITSVRGGSRAARAGLRKGDVIRTVDGNEVMNPSQLNQALSQTNPTQTLPVLIFRDGNLTGIQF